MNIYGCIFRMIHNKGNIPVMLLIANVLFLTLILLWNLHECIQLPSDYSSSCSTHIILVGNFAPEGAFVLEQNQRVWKWRPINTQDLLCLCTGKNGNPQLLHEVAWVRMVLALRVQNHVCSESEKLTSTHSCEFCLRILPWKWPSFANWSLEIMNISLAWTFQKDTMVIFLEFSE